MQGECLLKAPRPRDAGDAPPSLICRHCPGNAARVYPRAARAQINFVELVAPAPPQGSSIEKTRETLTGSDLATTKDLDTGFTTALRSPPSAQQEPRKTKQPDHGTETQRRHSSHRCHRLIGPSSSTVASSFVNNHFPSTIETSIATETNRPPGSDTDTSIFGTDGTAQLSHRGVCRVTRTPLRRRDCPSPTTPAWRVSRRGSAS